MDINEESVDSLWNLLKSAIQQILRKDNSGLCFSELYNIAYTLTQQRRGMKMYTGLKEIINEHLSNNVKQHVSINYGVQFMFKNIRCSHLALYNLSFQVKPEVLHSLYNNFLQLMYQTWTDYQGEIAMIEDIFIRMVGGLLHSLSPLCK